ncbi:hypothetical protein [Rufibacter roseolus]
MTFDKEVIIGGTYFPAVKYSLLIIPGHLSGS